MAALNKFKLHWSPSVQRAIALSRKRREVEEHLVNVYEPGKMLHVPGESLKIRLTRKLVSRRLDADTSRIPGRLTCRLRC